MQCLSAIVVGHHHNNKALSLLYVGYIFQVMSLKYSQHNQGKIRKEYQLQGLNKQFKQPSQISFLDETMSCSKTHLGQTCLCLTFLMEHFL